MLKCRPPGVAAIQQPFQLHKYRYAHSVRRRSASWARSMAQKMTNSQGQSEGRNFDCALLQHSRCSQLKTLGVILCNLLADIFCPCLRCRTTNLESRNSLRKLALHDNASEASQAPSRSAAAPSSTQPGSAAAAAAAAAGCRRFCMVPHSGGVAARYSRRPQARHSHLPRRIFIHRSSLIETDAGPFIDK